jgi:hypothetical protein
MTETEGLPMPSRSTAARVIVTAALVLTAVAIPVVARVVADGRVLTAAFRFREGITPAEVPGPPLQRKRYDCGPAALAELLRLRGVEARSEDLEHLAGTTPSGTTMLGLQEAAAAMGVKSQGMILGFDDLRRVPLPVLVFVKGRHFVLVTDVGAASVSLHDPALGRIKVGRAQFLRDWHGESLVFPAAFSTQSGGR